MFPNHFLRHIPAVRPVLLLLDGHSSHYNLTTLKMAAKEKVIIFCLPPHTTHLAQPLDVSCFSSLKAAWHEECHMYSIHNPGKKITRFQFSVLFSNAWFKAMTPSNITSGFRVCGVCPLNVDIFKIQEEVETRSESDDSGLPYIPLLTPMRKKLSSSLNQSELEDTSLNVDTVHVYPKVSSLAKFFPVPTPPPKRSASSKDLTSVQNLRIMTEKENAKQEAEKRRVIRQQKKAAKENESKSRGKKAAPGKKVAAGKQIASAETCKWL